MKNIYIILLTIILYSNSVVSQINIPDSELTYELVSIRSSRLSFPIIIKAQNKDVFKIRWYISELANNGRAVDCEILFYASKEELEELYNYINSKVGMNSESRITLGNDNIIIRSRLFSYDTEISFEIENTDCKFEFGAKYYLKNFFGYE